MNKKYRAVGTFSSRRETEIALRELIKKHGFPIEQVSVIAQHKEQNNINDIDYDVVEHSNRVLGGVATGSLTVGTLGGITGLLIGLGTIAIPGIGPIMLAGAATTAIATAIGGGAIGAATGTLVGGLVGLGIPQEQAKIYRHKVADGGYVTIIEGTTEEIQLAEEILSQYAVKDWEVYDAFEKKPTQKSTEIKAAEAVKIIEKPIESNHLRMMGTSPHLREAKTALIKLIKIGYPIERVTIHINDDDRHDWFTNLKVCNALDASFNRLPEERRIFFHDSFNRGQYILMMDGTDLEIIDAEIALRNEGVYSLYIFDPHNNSSFITSDLSLLNSRSLTKIIDRLG